MSACTLNLDFYRAVLLSKAAECRKQLLCARLDICVETASEAMERWLRAAEREEAAERVEGSYRLLQQVESALSRLKCGRYGTCLKCGEAIERKRLDALPWAMFCVHCQQAVDLLDEGAQARRNEVRRVA